MNTQTFYQLGLTKDKVFGFDISIHNFEGLENYNLEEIKKEMHIQLFSTNEYEFVFSNGLTTTVRFVQKTEIEKEVSLEKIGNVLYMKGFYSRLNKQSLVENLTSDTRRELEYAINGKASCLLIYPALFKKIEKRKKLSLEVGGKEVDIKEDSSQTLFSDEQLGFGIFPKNPIFTYKDGSPLLTQDALTKPIKITIL